MLAIDSFVQWHTPKATVSRSSYVYKLIPESYTFNVANRALDWFKQARNDLLWAEDTFTAKRYAQVCFVCQQVAAKFLKAYALFQGYDQIRSHSVNQICKALSINGELENMARKLDLYYISSRYPDAFPEGAPFEYFSAEQAEEALQFAKRFSEIISDKMNYHE